MPADPFVDTIAEEVYKPPKKAQLFQVPGVLKAGLAQRFATKKQNKNRTKIQLFTATSLNLTHNSLIGKIIFH